MKKEKKTGSCSQPFIKSSVFLRCLSDLINKTAFVFFNINFVTRLLFSLVNLKLDFGL